MVKPRPEKLSEFPSLTAVGPVGHLPAHGSCAPVPLHGSLLSDSQAECLMALLPFSAWVTTPFHLTLGLTRLYWRTGVEGGAPV